MYPLPYVPINNPYFPNGTMQPLPMGYHMPPIVKNYNVKISNLDGNITQIGNLYEDILPKAAIAQNRYTTLSERLVILNYYRSILVRHGDGEDINVGNEKNTFREQFEIHNLLSHVKVMDINPYHFSRLTTNPYRTLPDNMVMFRSCYPVRFNAEKNNVECAKDSMPTHIRMYSLSVFDVLAGKFPSVRKEDSDLWREIFYYEFVRNEIIKKKVCPNFVALYAYYLTFNSAINFQKLKELKTSKQNLVPSTNTAAVRANQALQNSVLESEIASILTKQKDYYSKNNYNLSQYPINLSLNNSQNVNISNLQQLYDYLAQNQTNATYKDIVTALNMQSNAASERCVVAITEGVTCNIIDWATKTYDITSGPIKRQVETGVINESTWLSVIFQLAAAMYTMDCKEVAFKNFSLNHNVFVKDLEANTHIVGYWKYTIKGVDFYIPNCGFILLVDSSYQDLQTPIVSVNFNNNGEQFMEHKIYGSFYNDTTKVAVSAANQSFPSPVQGLGQAQKLYIHTKNTWDNVAKENYENIFDYDKSFGQEFKNYGGIDLPQKIKHVLDEFKREFSKYAPLKKSKEYDDHEKDLGDIIVKVFSEHFVHNRVGTPLSKNEMSQLLVNNKQFREGELVAYEVNPSYYILSIYLSRNKGRNTHKIFTKDYNNDTFDFVDVTLDEVVRIHGNIEQTYKSNHKFSEDSLLESYIIS